MLEVLLGDLRRHHQGLQAERQVGSNEDRCHVAERRAGYVLTCLPGKSGDLLPPKTKIALRKFWLEDDLFLLKWSLDSGDLR